MTLVWEQEGENSGGFWGLYDDGNFVGEVYPLGDCFRWRDEVSNARRIEPSLAAARSACQARYEGEGLAHLEGIVAAQMAALE
jgi:hypothetical protein